MPTDAADPQKIRSKPRADTIRSIAVLEIAASLAASGTERHRQAKVYLREQGTADWSLCLFASSTNEGVEAIASGQADLAMINPSAALTLAYRGTGVFRAPQPVRVVAVIPSADQCVFAVKKSTGLTCVEDIASHRFPLRMSLRGQADHCLHLMLDDICAAAGFSLADVVAWGGEIRRESLSPPWPGDMKFQALAGGELDAIFDEGIGRWLDAAVGADMAFLPLSEPTVKKLEAQGYRRGVISRSRHPRLPRDILTVDFSGWPIFVHAELPDALAWSICAALEEKKHLIPWESEGPLPIERMCRDSPSTPLDVPLHPAAERYWRQAGYLP